MILWDIGGKKENSNDYKDNKIREATSGVSGSIAVAGDVLYHHSQYRRYTMRVCMGGIPLKGTKHPHSPRIHFHETLGEPWVS